MRCHACRSTMEAADKFCAGCGAPAQQNICTTCSRPNQPGNTFCVNCGHQLGVLASTRLVASSPSDLEGLVGELKYVTVLRADLVRSTDLVAGLESEQAILRLEPSLAAMRAAVRQFGGTVSKELGDGLLAVFGAPLADDNHARLACHAAIELLRRVGSLGDPGVQVRVGVHSGFVVAYLTTTEFASVYDVRGPALNLVERLQAVASPGQIYTSEACQKLAEGHISFERLAPKLLKGFANPVPLYRLTGVGDMSRWRVRTARNVSRFFGRTSEIAALTQAAADALKKSGKMVSLVGDPGVGKSRLVREFLQQLQGTGWQVIEAECSPILQASPFAMLKNLLTSIFAPHLPDGHSRDTKTTDPRAGLPQVWRSALDAVLDLAVADSQWEELEPRLRGRAIADACRAAIENVVKGQRTALLIEDLHWIDSASDAAIGALGSLTARHQLLILVTSRPNAATEWLSRRNVTRLWLRPLDDGSGKAMLDALLGPLATTADLKARILRHTGGVPLFIEEVCRRLVETDALQGQWGALTLNKPFDELGVPPTVQGIIAARIDRLNRQQRAVLQIAAAIGPRSAVASLRAVAGVPDASLEKQLVALDAAELLVEASLLPEHAYEFPHDLVRQVTYESMLEVTRERLHQRILAAFEAAALERLEDRSDTLCHHAVRAKNWPKSYSYSLSVARKCLARSAVSDATRYFEIAMDAVDRVPKSREHEEEAIDLRIESRIAFSRFGRVDRWLELAKEAEERADAIGDTPRKVAAMAVRAAALNFYGTPLEAIAAGQQVMRQAEELDDPGWVNYAEYGLGQAHFIAGRCREAEQMFGRACARLAGPDPKAPAGTTVRSILLLCCMMKCAAHVALGELEPAEFFQRRAHEIAAEGQRPLDRIAAGYSSGMYLLCRGNLAEAQAVLDEALHLARQHEVRLFIPVIACQLGIAYLEQGFVEQARKILTEARAEAEALGHTSVVLRASGHLALALCQCGETQIALQMARATRDAARQQGFMGVEAEALFSEANVLATASPSNTVAILNCLRGSLDIASQIEARPQVAKTKALLGRILASQGDFESAARESREAADLLATMKRANAAPMAK